MGLKRKLSFSDSPYLSPPPSSPPSSHSTSPQSQPLLADAWNIGGRSYINLRTRKRYRDNRPSDNTIHERTLEKLFSAQKNLHTYTTFPQPREEKQQTPFHSLFSEARYDLQSQASGEARSSVALHADVSADRNQRRLDAFFGVRQSTPAPTPTAPAPLSFQPSLRQPADIALCTSTCEDCYAPLQAPPAPGLVNMDIMDVDMVDPDHGDTWQCTVCAKRVCDTCAVRGDFRVCLECAVPGGGRDEREAISKRWVDGIGWM